MDCCNKKNIMYFLTSWDDGHLADIKLSNLLDRYNLKGTFFITQNFSNKGLSDTHIQEISANHEIGAHTISHPNLKTLSFNDQYREINESKLWIEGITSEHCDGFCYPSGSYNGASVKAVQSAGFKYARTVVSGAFNIDKDDIFRIPTTLHVYPYPFRKKGHSSYVWGDIFRPIINNKGLRDYLGFSGMLKASWLNLAISLFDYSVNNKEAFHLWGHSWEIEKYNMWNELELFFKHVEESGHVKSVTIRDAIKCKF